MPGAWPLESPGEVAVELYGANTGTGTFKVARHPGDDGGVLGADVAA